MGNKARIWDQEPALRPPPPPRPISSPLEHRLKGLPCPKLQPHSIPVCTEDDAIGLPHTVRMNQVLLAEGVGGSSILLDRLL